LTYVQETSAGGYDVVVTNLAGAAASAVATLTVTLPEVRFGDTVSLSTNGQLGLSFSGVPGRQYRIEGSTDLVDWQFVAQVTATNGPVPVVDTAAANFTRRFYRARQL
jgi:hypothetical protein